MSTSDSTATAASVNTVKDPKKSRMNAATRMEQKTGMRLCIQCDKLLPLDRFKHRPRLYTCITHLKETRNHENQSSQEKKAFNSIRCRAYADMVLFNHDRMFLPKTLVTAILSKEQVANFSNYCIIPKRPDKPLSEDNCIVVTSIQRIYVVAKWKSSRDPDQYENDLRHILNESSALKNK